ncbi:YqxA family protein [Bacillus massiliigorillae]|uniref:YqxA family protein n=1 Tax=Bacillus massiliigorillae TaxID=1243664 RepID=UPI0005A8DA6C|nr:YqxA family protein [Bacillus massiliigorillae]
MFRFFLKFLLVLIIFFVGVLLGMQKANIGMLNMRGYDDPKLYSAVSVEQRDGEIDASILGKEINSYDLQEKKEKLEEIKAFNAFSNLGKKITESSKTLFNKALDFVVPD